jgi:SAM-dependent methyltransferase
MTSQETKKLDNILSEHFVPLLEKHGNSHQSLDWGSENGQQLRFNVLLEPFFQKKKIRTLLDVGCGLAHLYTYLKEQNQDIEYSGIDAVEQMIQNAKLRHPEIKDSLQVSTLSEVSSKKYDLVIASGIFFLGCDKTRMENEIKKMFDMCEVGISFNSLSSWTDQKDEGEFYADPSAVLDYCRTLTKRCIIRHDYMPHDFTVHLFREN